MPTIASILDIESDPATLRAFEERAKADNLTRTVSDIRDLQKKREASGKPSLRQTRVQRAFDISTKLLKKDADLLGCLRALAVGNYFVVTADLIVALRNMTHRELKDRGIKYVTTKFIFGREEYLKVHRYNHIHDKQPTANRAH